MDATAIGGVIPGGSWIGAGCSGICGSCISGGTGSGCGTVGGNISGGNGVGRSTGWLGVMASLGRNGILFAANPDAVLRSRARVVPEWHKPVLGRTRKEY